MLSNLQVQLIGMGNRQMMNGRQNNILPYLPRFTNMTWPGDSTKQNMLNQSVTIQPAHMFLPPESFAPQSKLDRGHLAL